MMEARRVGMRPAKLGQVAPVSHGAILLKKVALLSTNLEHHPAIAAWVSSVQRRAVDVPVSVDRYALNASPILISRESMKYSELAIRLQFENCFQACAVEIAE